MRIISHAPYIRSTTDTLDFSDPPRIQLLQASKAIWIDDELDFDITVAGDTAVDALYKICEHVDVRELQVQGLHLVGGLDISYRLGEPGGPLESATLAVATLAVCSFPSMKLLHSISTPITIQEPYVPGYLSFREAGHFASLLEELVLQGHQLPQVLFVDGNGRLHERMAGSAVQVGLLTQIPTLGVAKDFHPPALNSGRSLLEYERSQKGMKEYARVTLQHRGDWYEIYGSDSEIAVGAVGAFSLIHSHMLHSSSSYHECRFRPSYPRLSKPRQGPVLCHPVIASHWKLRFSWSCFVVIQLVCQSRSVWRMR